MDKKLKNEIAKKLNKMEQNLRDADKVRARWLFVDKFIRCEVACKRVLNAYHLQKGQEISLDQEKLDMKIIPAAMKWAELEFTKEELGALFGGKGSYAKRGCKSAKNLRNGAVHAHDENDIQEIVDRFEELDQMMDAFLSHFRQTEVELTKQKKTAKEAAAV